MMSIFRGALMASLSAALLTVATPATAAPVLTSANCQAAGGTFTVSKGTRTCTTIESRDFGQAYATVSPYGYGEAHYLANFMWWTPTTVTTTQTQQGNGPIRTTVTYTPRADEAYVTDQYCWYLTFDPALDHWDYDQRPVAECDALGLYSPSAEWAD